MISIITITACRNAHLNNMLDGIALGTLMPREVVVVDMTGDAKIKKEYDFMIKVQTLQQHLGELPLAVARNIGARTAWEEDLIFLDVDCIPNPNFVEQMEVHIHSVDGVIMGEPRYLTQSIEKLTNESNLFKNSVYHRDRPELTNEITECLDPGMFWSICFGVKKDLFTRLGGFDESFVGYGAEDTDFAFTMSKKNVKFYLSRNTVYHQPHKIFSPPLNHFESIVENSNRFYKKWGKWPMQVWLTEFSNLELIDWNENSKKSIKILKEPNEELVLKAEIENEPFI